MTNADRKEFAVEMSMLAEVFGEQLSDTRLEIYFEDLKVYDWEHVALGIRSARASRKFFPKIADIAECIDEAVEARVQRHAATAKAMHALPSGPRMSELRRAGEMFALPERPSSERGV